MEDENQPAPPRPGWEPLPHEQLPRPNYFPAGMAMGTAFIFWGVITSYVIVFIGLGLFTAALAGWITEIRHERKNANEHAEHAPCKPPTPEEINRRRFFQMLCVGLGGVCAAILGVPLVGFIVAPFFRKTPQDWVSLGKVDAFEIGKTVNVTFSDPSPLPWAGVTSKSAAWLRRDSAEVFIAFSVNCTHLGCPIRWLPDAELFMCPCHGGVYYKDGSVAAGPPPKPLFRYECRIENGVVQLKTAAIPITTT